MDVNSRRNRGQDVTMMAAEDALSSMDPETRGKFEKVISEVDDEAREGLLAGITDPVGFFDPLAFATTDISGGRLLFYREVELKHGRVAMLASLGILVGEQFHPLFGGDIDVPAYVAFQQTPLPPFGLRSWRRSPFPRSTRSSASKIQPQGPPSGRCARTMWPETSVSTHLASSQRILKS
jgi:hypothetical protein